MRKLITLISIPILLAGCLPLPGKIIPQWELWECKKPIRIVKNLLAEECHEPGAQNLRTAIIRFQGDPYPILLAWKQDIKKGNWLEDDIRVALRLHTGWIFGKTFERKFNENKTAFLLTLFDEKGNKIAEREIWLEYDRI